MRVIYFNGRRWETERKRDGRRLVKFYNGVGGWCATLAKYVG